MSRRSEPYFNDQEDYLKIQHTLEQHACQLDKLPLQGKKSYIEQHPVLADYSAFLALRDKAYPLLLSNGESFDFSRAPSHVYLLPEIKGLKRNVRWILCQYPKRPHNPQAGVQLLAWRINQAKSCISSVDAMPVPITTQETGILEERALQISVSHDEDEISLVLKFRSGRLRMIADVREGLIDARWRATKKTAFRQQERCSGGNMRTLLWVERQSGDHWCHDRLYDGENHPLAISEKLGHIKGVDGSADGSVVYFGGTTAKIYGLQVGADKPLIQSQPFADKINDVLVIPHPNRSQDDMIIAACADGHLYFLRPDWSTGEIQTQYYQSAKSESHIARLVGQSQHNILLLDTEQRFQSVSIQNPESFTTLRDRLTQHLFTALEPDRYQQLQTDHAIFGQWARLYFECILWALKQPNDALCNEQGFSHLCDVIDQSYGAQDNLLLAGIHSTLLNGFCAWLKNRLFLDERKHILRVLRLIRVLLTPPEQAPDWLWIQIFRQHDLLCPFREIHPEIDALYRDIVQAVQQKREALMAGMQVIRPLSITSSTRITSPPRRLRSFNQDGLVALLDHQRGLTLLRVVSDDTKPWDVVYTRSAGKDDDHCSMLLAGQGVQAILGGGKNELYLFVATDFGFLSLHCLTDWRTKQPKLQQVWKTDIRCIVRCGKVIKTLAKGLLLGGQNADGLACIVWAPVNHARQLGDVAFLWTGTEGTVRHLAVDEEQQQLWALVITKGSGELLHWSLSALNFRKKLISLARPEHWLAQTNKLYTLCHGGKDNGLIVCGGHGGLVFALDAHTGDLQWVFGCGGNVRRLRYIGEKNVAWLVSGDMPHVFMLNQNGALCGVLENVGPVTSLCRLDDDKALVGNRDGRIMILQDAVVDSASTNDICTVHAPLSGHDNLADQSIQDLLSILNQYPYPGEMMPDMIRLRAVWQQLPTTSAQAHFQALLVELNKQLAHRVACLLATSYQLLSPRQGIQLLDALWRDLRCRDEPLVCQLVSQILTILEVTMLSDDADAASKDLIQCIHECVWSKVQYSGCANNLYQRERLRDIQISQSTRMWHRTHEQPSTPRRLAHWVWLLSRIWGIQGMPILRERLHLIAQSAVLFSPHEREWSEWLTAAAQNRNETIPHPAELSILIDSSLTDWRENAVERLKNVWPDNQAWQEWLDEFERWLLAYQTIHVSPRKEAWREWQTLQDIEAHVRDVGGSFFALPQHPLLALWWPIVMREWQIKLDRAKERLQNQCLAQPACIHC